MARVVVTDFTFPDLKLEESILAPLGHGLVGAKHKTVDALIPFVSDADAVLTQFAPIRAEVIAAMQKARVIVRYGIGVDNVDLEAARQKGIPVCNVPDYCIDEVADHTLAFILALTRQVVPNCLHVRGGQWGLATDLENMTALRERTVGIVGFGRIGQGVANRLGPFGCRRLVFDPLVDASTVHAAGCERVSWEQLVAESDVLSLHCPSTEKTRKMVNADTFSAMKTGAILINVARGDLVDTGALTSALASGKLRGAALDVCDPEPIPADSLLRSHPNVVVASHIASASVKAVAKLRRTVASLAASALAGEPLKNVVNNVR